VRSPRPRLYVSQWLSWQAQPPAVGFDPGISHAAVRLAITWDGRGFGSSWVELDWIWFLSLFHGLGLCRVTSLSTWRHCELDQRVIDTAVRQSRARLRARVKAKGGHFEHRLIQ